MNPRFITRLILVAFFLGSVPGALASALHDYVAQPDENYTWRQVEQRPFEGGTCYLLHMTSQAWRSPEEVNRPLWHHWLAVYVPDQVEHRTGLLWIGGGDNQKAIPEENGFLGPMARRTRSLCAELHTVPNQPLRFSMDPEHRRRTEDDILAFAWARHLETGDPDWLANLPMTKSAVRAMDTVTAFSRDLPTLSGAVERFVVTGGSKRGWTTWLCAAVDERVVGIAPMVIDMLNLKSSMRHHHTAYGTYAEAIAPYVENGIMAAMETPVMEASLAIVDPYAYHREITIPQLLLNSTGDQFFLPDSSQFYYRDLPGPKSLRYLPNTDHGLSDSAAETLETFFKSVLKDQPLPVFTWKSPRTGTLVVNSPTEPVSAALWQAHNPKTRDFRVDTIGKIWQETKLKPKSAQGAWRIRAKVKTPRRGWTAFLVELKFKNSVYPGRTVTLTTEVFVTPQELPFAQKPSVADTGK
jgi:PhoPQ-activated pathogenicity-related protein